MLKNIQTLINNKKMFFILKVLLAALIISGASWISGKHPKLAGFIVALPLVTLIVLVFSYIEHKNVEATITFAKSILIGVFASYFFFVPFFFAKTLNMNFWAIYFSGLALLIVAYFVHKFIVSFF
tara:strand:+ start:2562 stop:2936 length:375 start_codon:yes stop_codon:yes gene_type:complete